MRDVNMQIRQEPLFGGVAGSAHHIGHIVMDFFNKPEDHVWQIDAATGEVEMKSSVKSRSVQLARCLRNAGLKPGDVVAVSGLNHLDVHIPFYAGYLNGLPLSGIDTLYKYARVFTPGNHKFGEVKVMTKTTDGLWNSQLCTSNYKKEIKNLFKITEPKLVFCELSNLTEYEMVVKDLGLDTTIVTFGDSDKSYAKFVKKYDDNAPESAFRVATFDTNKVFVWLVSTSGTTGLPKVAAFSQSEIIKMVHILLTYKENEIVPILSMSSVQWISGYLSTLCMITYNQIKVQTSGPATVEHVIDIINKYKPTSWTTSPLLLNKIMKHDKYCDMTCFRKLIATAFAMNPVFIQKLKKRIGPNGAVLNLLGLTECLGPILIPVPDGPLGNCGKELPSIPVQLVDTKTGEVIKEPNTIGELWTKGPRLTEYYKNPEATAATFSSDGWLKTGDLVYRDENGYFFFVERITSSFRFRNFFVTPMELEHVIQLHPDVVDVCVVGIPDPEDNMHAVACVQKRPGSALTEQNVKDIVADTFSFHKHLHGGVIFVDDFPRTFSDKIARGKVRDFVLELRKPSDYPCSGNTKNLIITFQRLSSTDNVRL